MQRWHVAGLPEDALLRQLFDMHEEGRPEALDAGSVMRRSGGHVTPDAEAFEEVLRYAAAPGAYVLPLWLAERRETVHQHVDLFCGGQPPPLLTKAELLSSLHKTLLENFIRTHALSRAHGLGSSIPRAWYDACKDSPVELARQVYERVLQPTLCSFSRTP